MWRYEAQVGDITRQLGLTAYPDSEGLRDALLGSAALLIFIACGLTVLMIFSSRLGLSG